MSTSRRLQRALSDGAGMEETYPTFLRLVRSSRRAVREVRRIDLGETTLANIEAMADRIRKLRPYYEPEAPIQARGCGNDRAARQPSESSPPGSGGGGVQ